MKKSFVLFLLLLVSVQIACSASKPKEGPVSLDIKHIQDLMEKGNYDEAIKASKDILAKTPASADSAQALYLQGYILAYDRSDLQNARPLLRKLVEDYPKSEYVVPAQKLIADSQYWQGHYKGAIDEYKKLITIADTSTCLYSKLQIGNCLLLNDKVTEALTHYHDLMEKNPSTTIAESAQLMTANAYLKLQNVSQAKKELKKLIAQSQNHDIQESAQKALRQIEEEANFDKSSNK